MDAPTIVIMLYSADILEQIQQLLSEIIHLEVVLNEVLQELHTYTNLSSPTQTRTVSMLQNSVKDALLSAKVYLTNATINRDFLQSIQGQVKYVAAGFTTILKHLDTVSEQEIVTLNATEHINVSLVTHAMPGSILYVV